ncbi:T9SS type A sorting domain-containing protein [Owenweeksia hongkongensis]|uniref:T9SS type A sorting domain-containing protein n=1 Tax=Owenweeksia hongkongensis TaxID=253245 RepID=UPI003A95A36C
MKSKITLVTMALLASTFAFGQQSRSWNPGEKKQLFIEKVQRPNIPKQIGNQNTERHLSKQVTHHKASTAALKHRLDSIVSDTLVSAGQWAPNWVEKFEYDWLGNNTKWAGYSINGNVQTPYYEDHISYNSNGNQTQYISHYNYNIGTSSFDDGSKQDNFYNNSQHVIKYVRSNWNTQIQQFEPFYKDTLIYNSAGNPSQTLSYSWNPGTGQWEANYKADYIYDSNGNNSEQMFYWWDSFNNQWEPSQRYVYDYNSNGALTQYISSQYNYSTSTWVNNYKYVNTYDPTGNLTESISFDWDPNMSAWVNRYKDELSYDSNGNETEVTFSIWDSNLSVWDKYHRYTTSYDANSNPTAIVNFIWDPNLGQWVNEYKDDISFDLNVPSADVVAGIYNEYSNKLLGYTSKFWDIATNQWQDEYRGTFYYTQTNTIGIVENQQNTAALYPNPASNLVYFSLENQEDEIQITISDLMGQMVLQATQSPNLPIQVSSLTSGLYNVNITQEMEHFSSKLMIK